MASSQLADRVSCAVCMETFDNQSHVPQLLPCQHTFCQSCITQAMNKDRFPETLKCPTCRSTHTVPKKGFTTNRALLDVAEELQKDKKTSSDLKCTLHPKKASVLVCVDCLHGLCVTCVRTSSQTHDGHQLEELDEATSLLQRKRIRDIDAQKKELKDKLQQLQNSMCSPDKLKQEEANILKIRDKLRTEINTWANERLASVQQLKSKALHKEKELQSNLDSFEQQEKDLTLLIPPLHKPKKNDDQFTKSIQRLEMSWNKHSQLSQGTRRRLLERIKSILIPKDSLQSSYLGQVESDKVDVTARENRATGGNRQPTSNIHSLPVGHIRQETQNFDVMVAEHIATGRIRQPDSNIHSLPMGRIRQETPNFDAMVAEHTETGRIRQPDSNIHSLPVGLIRQKTPNVDVMVAEHIETGRIRQPDSNIHSHPVGRISDYENVGAFIKLNLLWCFFVLILLLSLYRVHKEDKYPADEIMRERELQGNIVTLWFKLHFVCMVLQVLSRKILTLTVVDNSGVSTLNYICKFLFVMFGLLSFLLWCYTVAVHPDPRGLFFCCILVLISTCACQLVSPELVKRFF